MTIPRSAIKPALLMKLRADDANGTEFMSKFTHKVQEVFSGLPKPKDWISFATNEVTSLVFQ